MWNEDETGGGSCNEFRSACSVFNEIEDKCESAKDIRWQSPTKACVHSITDTSNCQDYNACTPATDEAACQAKDKCEWQEGGSYGGVTIGSCQYTDSVDRDEGAPYCAGLTAKKECGPTGSNPAKHCMWIVSDNQICQNYDHCTDLKESQCSNDASCQSQGKGDDFICTAKQGGEGGAEFYNCGNTTAAGKAACNKLVDDDGERLCIFLVGEEDADDTAGSDDKDAGDDQNAGDDQEPSYGGQQDYSSQDRCTNYDVCLEAEDAETCGGLGVKGCAWNNGQCRDKDAFGAGNGGYGNGGSYDSNDGYGGSSAYGGGNTYGGGGYGGGNANPCDQFDTQSACNAQLNEYGRRFCDFGKEDNGYCGVVDVCNNFASSKSKCEAKDCTYYANDDDGVDGQCVTEGDVKGSEDCIGVDNAGDCTNAGSVCEWKDTEAQETCLALDACALFGEDKCNDEDGCGWTRNFDAEGYDDDAAMVCSSEQAANNNEFVQAPSCSTQENQTACDDFSDPFAKFYFEADDDTDGNPECMWNSRTTSYCNAYDKCTNYPSESKCKTDDECHWKANDDSGANQNETPEKSCVKRTNNNNQGAGSGESEADPSQACYSGKETQKDCEAVNKGSRICDWVVTENAYCMNWALCSGRPELENEDDCVAKRGCSWLESTEQCLASELTTTSTTTTTTTTSTTTTTFHCNSDMFLCTTGEQCIREGWYCDGDPDCADESDEVGCPTETTTTSTGTLTTKTAKITTATTKTTTSKTTVTTTTTTTTTRTATTTTTTEPACVLSGECPSVTRYLDAKDPITGRSKYSTTAICRACALDQTIEEVCAVQNGAGCPEATTSTASAAALSTADVTTFEMDLTAAASVSDGEVAAAVTNALGAERDIPLTSILKVEVGVRTEGAYTEISVYSSRSSGTVMILKSIQVKEVKQVVLDDDSPLKIWNPNNYDTSNLMDATEGSLGLGDPRPVGAVNPNGNNNSGGNNDDNGGGAVANTDLTALDGMTNEELRAEMAAAADAAAAARAANGTQAGSGGDGGGGGSSSTNIVVVIVPVVVVLLIAIGVLVWVVKRKSAGFQQGGSGQRYENPAYAPGNRPGAATSGAPSAGGLPSWADPNIPFLSRSEAEGQLKQQGLSNGAYVVRQTVNTIAGYVVTATHSGKFANIQLKNNGGALYYGAKAVGSNLSEAIASLQTSVQVAASGIMPFHLQAGPASGYIGDMDA